MMNFPILALEKKVEYCNKNRKRVQKAKEMSQTHT